MSRRRVFVVDDDVSVRRALHRLLRAADYAVDTFASAADFLAQVTDSTAWSGGPDGEHAPACVVLDVRMPGQSGLDLYETLAERGCEVSVIFITGHGDVPMAVKAMKAGAVDFLAKPFTEDALLAAVGRVFADDVTWPDVRQPEGGRPVA